MSDKRYGKLSDPVVSGQKGILSVYDTETGEPTGEVVEVTNPWPNPEPEDIAQYVIAEIDPVTKRWLLGPTGENR